jgi:hypothetical protein
MAPAARTDAKLSTVGYRTALSRRFHHCGSVTKNRVQTRHSTGPIQTASSYGDSAISPHPRRVAKSDTPLVLLLIGWQGAGAVVEVQPKAARLIPDVHV